MNIGILGTGAFGIALATCAFNNKNKVTMWTKFEDEYNMLKEYHKNIKVLPDTIIPEEIEFTLDMEECIKDKDLIIMVIPSSAYEDVCIELQKIVSKEQIICIASKGIHNGIFLSDIVSNYLDNDICAISGPSFAIDLISNKPIGLSIASKNLKVCDKVITALSSPNLRLTKSSDVIGIQLCGTIKNAFAIGSGILNGLNCLESTKASYLTQCLNETRKLLIKLNCSEETVLEYAGIGDLILTCNSTKSRNFSFGNLIGSKEDSDKIEVFKSNNLIEGILALKNISEIAKKNNIEINIIDYIYKIVFDNENPDILLNFINEKAS